VIIFVVNCVYSIVCSAVSVAGVTQERRDYSIRDRLVGQWLVCTSLFIRNADKTKKKKTRI